MGEEFGIMTLFSTEKSLWENLLNEIKQKFVIKEAYTAVLNDKNWHNYFSDFYSIQDRSSKKDARIIKKGKIIEKFGTEMLVISILYSNREEIIKFKKSTREKYKVLLNGVKIVEKNPLAEMLGIKNVPGEITIVSSWIIIHSFEKGTVSMQANDFIKKKCKINSIEV